MNAWNGRVELTGRPRTHDRGSAMVLVLSAVVVAAIVSYAVLTAATLSAQGQRERREAAMAGTSAEDGAKLAMHYLLRPDESPVALVVGDAGNEHYPGQSDLHIGDTGATTSISVVNTAQHVYDVTSLVTGSDGVVRRLKATVRGEPDVWEPVAGLHLGSGDRLAAGVNVEGGLWVNGDYNGGGTVVGDIYANNYLAAPTGDCVPAFAELSLIQAASASGWYTYNGQTCRGDFVYSSLMTSQPTANPSNLGRVFFYTGTTPLTLNFPSSGGDGEEDGGEVSSGNSSFNGTLVVTQTSVTLNSGLDFKPLSQMPGLIVKGDVQCNSSSQLRVEGLAYFGGNVLSTSGSAGIEVDGCTIAAGGAATFAGGFAGNVRLRFDEAKANVPGFSTAGPGYKRLTVEAWDNR